MFDGGVEGEEDCRYGPEYFIIPGSMHGLWGWRGWFKSVFGASQSSCLIRQSNELAT